MHPKESMKKGGDRAQSGRSAARGKHDPPPNAPDPASDPTPDHAAPIRARAALSPASRAAFLILGCITTAVISTFIAASVNPASLIKLSATIPAGLLIGALLAHLFIFVPERRHRQDLRTLEQRIDAVAGVDRDQSMAALLDIDLNHPLAPLARAVHEAVTAAYRDRLEAARLRRDMSAQVDRKTRQATARLLREAETDHMTGLLNRRGFERRLEELWHTSSASGAELVLIAIDLDNFKKLNDSLGHEKGDRAIAVAGEILRANLRDDDVAGRLGGDEMMVAMLNSDVDQAKRAAERLMRLFAQHPLARAFGKLWPTMSIGIAAVVEDGALTTDQLRQFADRALYASKRSGRSCFVTFEESRLIDNQAA